MSKHPKNYIVLIDDNHLKSCPNNKKLVKICLMLKWESKCAKFPKTCLNWIMCKTLATHMMFVSGFNIALLEYGENTLLNLKDVLDN
jgi:hypothetical protein